MGQTASCGPLGNGVLNLFHTTVYNCNQSNMFQSILLLRFFFNSCIKIRKNCVEFHPSLFLIVFYVNCTAGSCRTKTVFMSFADGGDQWRLLCWE